MSKIRTLVCTLALLAVVSPAPHAADGPYQFIKHVEIGGEGGWDYLNLDAAAYTPPPAGAAANARPTMVPGSIHLKIYGLKSS